MMDSTKTALAAIMRGDPSISPEEAQAAIAALKGKTARPLVNPEPMDRTLSRSAVAEILGVTPRTVSIYARRGIIRPCRFGSSGRRASGYSEASVREALAGRKAENWNAIYAKEA